MLVPPKAPPPGVEAKICMGNVWEKEVVEFEAIPNPILSSLLDSFPEKVFTRFNHDTRYLLEMARAVEAGKFKDRWANQKAMAMTNAGWMNTESRVLRVYMSTASPSEAQRRMCHFKVYVFVPTLLESTGTCWWKGQGTCSQ